MLPSAVVSSQPNPFEYCSAANKAVHYDNLFSIYRIATVSMEPSRGSDVITFCGVFVEIHIQIGNRRKDLFMIKKEINGKESLDCNQIGQDSTSIEFLS